MAAEQTTAGYEAFISYRHKEQDMAVAKALHKQLETYRIPAYIRQKTGKKKMGKVFRDQDELPLLADLGEGIRRALEQSRWLIVVCSPDLPLSKWCLAEVDYFIGLGRQDHILTVLIAGEPEESFPTALRYINGAEREPLAADVRAESLGQTLRKIRREKLRLLAPMLGVGYDDLRRRQRERLLKQVAVVGATALTAMAGATAYVLAQNRLLANQVELTEQQRQIAVANEAWAVQEKNEALISQSKFLADLSRQETERGDPALAALLALEALPKDLQNPDRPLVPEAAAALTMANLADYQQGYELVSAIPAAYTESFAYWESQDMLLLFRPEGTELYNGRNGATMATMEPLYPRAYVWEENGDRLVTAVRNEDETGLLRVYTLPDMTCREIPLREEGRGLTQLTLLPLWEEDKILVAYSAAPAEVQVYDIAAGQWADSILRQYLWGDPEGILTNEERPAFMMLSSFALSPDGRYLAYYMAAAPAAQSPVWVMDRSTKEITARLGTGEEQYDVAYTPDGLLCLRDNRDYGIQLWSADGTEQLVAWGRGMTDNPVGFCKDFAFSPDGRFLAMQTYDDKAVLYDIEEGAMREDFLMDKTVAQLAFTDGNTVAYREGIHAPGVRLWHVTGKSGIIDLPGGLHNPVTELEYYNLYPAVFHTAGDVLVTYNRQGLYQIWRQGPNKRLMALEGLQETDYTAQAFSPDGSKVFVSAGGQNLVCDTTTGEQLNRQTLWEVTQARWSPDGTQLLVASRDGIVRLWNLENNTLMGMVLSQEANPLFDVTLTASPDWAYAALGGAAGTGGIYRMPGLELVGDYGQPELFGLMNTGAFLPGGEGFCVADDGGITVRDIETGAVTARYDYAAEEGMAVSPDGTKLAFFEKKGPEATAPEGMFVLVVIDTQEGRALWRQDAHSRVYGRPPVWSPDSRRVAASHGTATQTKVWDSQTGQLLAQCPIDWPSFNRDGSHIMGSADNRSAVYDIARAEGGAGLLLAKLPKAGLFNPAREQIVTAGGLWTPPTLEETMEKALAKLESRTLTPAERQAFYLE